MCLSCTVTKNSVNKILEVLLAPRVHFLLRLSAPYSALGNGWSWMGGIGESCRAPPPPPTTQHSPKLQHRCFLSGTVESGNYFPLSLGCRKDLEVTKQ